MAARKPVPPGRTTPPRMPTAAAATCGARTRRQEGRPSNRTRPVEAIWTTTAAGLVLGPLEAVVGSRRLIALGVLGHALPTILVDLCWLVTGKAGQGLDGLDVGSSAVVVAAAAALAVTTRSLPVAAVLVAGLAVDIAAAPDLATTEHLIAVAIGVSLAMAFSRERSGATAPSDSASVDAAPVELTRCPGESFR